MTFLGCIPDLPLNLSCRRFQKSSSHFTKKTRGKGLGSRGRHQIPKCSKKQPRNPNEGPFTADEAAAELSVTESTIHRWLREGVLAGEQMTPGAPWRIVLTDEVRRKLAGGDAPEGWVSLG